MKKLSLLGLILSALAPLWASAEGEWARTPYEFRSRNTERFYFDCPQVASLPNHYIWGTDVYTDDSSICMAAVHAGKITIAGGRVYFQPQPGAGSYLASTRNGVESRSYSSWGGSFIIIDNPGSAIIHGGHDPAKKIAITMVAGFPNSRSSNDPPANAIDGNLNTFTWTTEAFNVASASYLAIGFASANVGSLSVWKTNEGGGGENIKDLTIEYTTDTGPLESRTWMRVNGLTSGFNGNEPFRATYIYADGQVTGDTHNSTGGDGWGSLTFSPVMATGLRIGFKNQRSFGGCSGANPPSDCNHYRVAEFEAYSP